MGLLPSETTAMSFRRNKPQQEGITTKPGDKELFIFILQKNQ